MSDAVVEVEGLYKTFRVGFFRKKVEAVRGVSFRVARGEFFGLLGPNGAGKTTSIKCLLGLIHPDAGQLRVFGAPTSEREAMRRVGYMPENPYVYQYLRPLEFLDLCGRLMGMDAAARRSRSLALLERLSLSHALDRPIGRFSKGMMQRVGIAQALLHDPELIILDEPMSGLDPVGQRDMRELLLEQKRAGKTLIFTSHILGDVETLCDRVVLIGRGKVTAEGTMEALLRSEVRRVGVELAEASDALVAELAALPCLSLSAEGGRVRLRLEGDPLLADVLARAQRAGARLVEVVPEKESLEALFLRDAMAV